MKWVYESQRADDTPGIRLWRYATVSGQRVKMQRVIIRHVLKDKSRYPIGKALNKQREQQRRAKAA